MVIIRKAMLIDESKCTACRGCQVPCKQWNDLVGWGYSHTKNSGSYENPPRLSPQTWTRIKFNEYESPDGFRWLFLKEGCMQNSITDRPGWLRCEQFGAGRITGWGQHHFDSAAWGMDTELTGPVSIEAVAEFPKSGLWDVHGDFMAKAEYKNGITMYTSGGYPNGIRYEGTEGWIFVTRGSYTATPSDPTAAGKNQKALDASDPKILSSVIKENEIHIYVSDNQHGNWLDCIKSGKEPISPVEIGHRACSVCLITHIAMKVGRKLSWDPDKEVFINDAEANKWLSRQQRKPYGTDYIKI